MGLLHEEQTGNCNGLDIHALCQANRIYSLSKKEHKKGVKVVLDQFSGMLRVLRK